MAAANMTVSTCPELAAAMADRTVSSISLASSLTVGGCMPGWSAGEVDIDRALTIAPGPSGGRVQLIVADQRFVDYFSVSGSLRLVELFVVAPANVSRTASDAFLPVLFAPKGAGAVVFERSLLALSRADAHAYAADGAVGALGARPVPRNEDFSSYRAVGADRLVANIYYVPDAALACSEASPQLSLRVSPFAQRLGACGATGKWAFVDSLVTTPTPYAGGLIVSTGLALAEALNTTTVGEIFVAADVDVGSVFEAYAVNATTQRFLLGRDLHIYGEYRAQIDFSWAAEVVTVVNGASLTIDGGLVLQRVSRPTASSLPYNMFLGAFVFRTGSTLRLHDTVVEHLPSSDLELWALAGGAPDPANVLPAVANATWSATDYAMHAHASSQDTQRAMQDFLPDASKPSLTVDAGNNLFVNSWAIDEAVWDAAVVERANQNDVDASFDLQRVSLLPPAFSPDECDNTTGVPVWDSASLLAAVNNPQAYRLKVIKSFVIDPSLFPQPDNATTAIYFTRRFRMIGCESETEYTVVDTADMFRVLWLVGYGSLQLRRLRFINTFQAPRRQDNILLLGFVTTNLENATIDAEGCAFEGSGSNTLGPLFDPNYLVGLTAGAAEFLPSYSRTSLLADPTTGQLSRVVPIWALTIGPYLAVTQGNLSALPLLGAWNNKLSVVSTRALPLPSGGGSSSSAVLAVAIAVPLAVALCLALSLGAWLLSRRRRQRRAAAMAALAASKRSVMRVSGRPSQSTSPRALPPTAPSSAGSAPPPPAGALLTASAMEGRIDAVLLKLGKQAFSANAWEQIKLGRCIGSGGFSRVYKGYWRGSVVAVKVTLLPAHLTRMEKLKRMAVMETAISASLMHPNIISTYTYAVRSARPGASSNNSSMQTNELASSQDGPAADKSSGTAFSEPPAPSMCDSSIDHVLETACEVRLVQEFAPLGSLRDAIKVGRLCARDDPQGRQHFGFVLDTAMDMCKALVHLHNESVVHCDLKPSNVLLVPSSDSPKGFVAKVADFGMAQSVPIMVTHVSNVWQGTLTHMAPEVLVFGHVTFASDIYALGIVMWEMVTRQAVHLACLASMVPFMVSARGLRPIIPAFVPAPFAELIRACWAGDHSRRPTAQQVYHTLADLSVQLAEGSLGPCVLETSAPVPEASAANTEYTGDCVSTRLLSCGADAPQTTSDFVNELQEACNSLGSTARIAASRSTGLLSSPSPSGTPEMRTSGSNFAPSVGSNQHQGSMDASRTTNELLPSVSSGRAPTLTFTDDMPPPAAEREAERPSPPVAQDSYAFSQPVGKPEAAQPAPLIVPAALTPALVRRDKDSGGPLIFKSESDSFDTFMLNQSDVGFQGLGLTAIVEPPLQPGVNARL